MNYCELFEKMKQVKMISPIWLKVLKMLEAVDNSDNILKTLTLYFSLIDEGNVYMSLNENDICEKFNTRLTGLKQQSLEEGEDNQALFDELKAEIAEIAKLANEISSSASLLSADGKAKLFVAENGRLYTRLHFNSVKSIIKSSKRIFTVNSSGAAFDIEKYLLASIKLTDGQKQIINKGLTNNLLVTGGPGTGKTTSILFLILALLLNNPDFNVYLTAPSGKAAARMKESILNSALNINAINADTEKVLDKIKGLKEYTIHRLLRYDPQNNLFKYNKDNQFEENAIFVIDEASMIDVNLFAQLLEAIPEKARVFILGDKNQLPSVECGAVFGRLLEEGDFAENIVELDQSKRFSNDSEIFKLSEAVNKQESLDFIKDIWKRWEEFEIAAEDKSDNTPIFYYVDNAGSDTRMIDEITEKWYKHFYGNRASGFRKKCGAVIFGRKESGEIEADEEPLTGDSLDRFSEIWNIAEKARILCASNKTVRGVEHINEYIVKNHFGRNTKAFYPGELLMINKNNTPLELYNGDCGVVVKFSGDENLYLMFKKNTSLDIESRKAENRIFKLGNFLFYPISLINSDDISPAFAITIHKSQGSDYDSILVILPKDEKHPLLNKQIVYTAITRTKKNTYILSNQKNLETASKTVIKRDTF